MKEKKIKIAIVGNLAGVGYSFAKPLARLGISVDLLLARWEKSTARIDWENEASVMIPNLNIFNYGLELDTIKPKYKIHQLYLRLRYHLEFVYLLPRLLAADVIISSTGSLFISPILFFVFGYLKLRPYIACATGSDIREVAMLDGGSGGQLMRKFFNVAGKTLLLNIDMINIAKQLELSNAQFFPFSIDVNKYNFMQTERLYCNNDDLLIFMPSNLDWGIKDNQSERNSTKGNNRLIAAFARFIHQGYKGHLLLLDRGPDRELAKELVQELGITEKVTFLPTMQKTDLINHIRMSDIIADQFDIGSFGLTGLEAMSCSKPVMIYIDQDCAYDCYPELPPVLNVSSEDEIFNMMIKATDSDMLKFREQSARKWISKYHNAFDVALFLKKICDLVINKKLNKYLNSIPLDWELWIKKAGFQAGFLQSLAWARIDAMINNARVHWVDIFEGEDRVIGALFRHKKHALEGGRIVQWVNALRRPGNGYLECSEGPILMTQNPEHLNSFLKKVEILANNLGVSEIYFRGKPPLAAWPNHDMVHQIFSKYDYKIDTWLTSVVDLESDEISLLRSFRASARKGINKCKELGIIVRECQSYEEYIKSFHESFFESRKSIGRVVPLDYLEKEWWHLDYQKNYHYFVAYGEDGKILGTLGTYRFNRMAVEIMSERTNIARLENLPVQDSLHWYAFLFHKALGDKYFDLAGFSPNPLNEKEKGIRRFKEKWGGTFFEIYHFVKKSARFKK